MDKNIWKIINSLSSEALQYFFPGLKMDDTEQDDITLCEQTVCIHDCAIEEIPDACMGTLEDQIYPIDFKFEDNIPSKEDTLSKKISPERDEIRFSVSQMSDVQEDDYPERDKYEDIRGFFDGGGSGRSYSPSRHHTVAKPKLAPKPKVSQKKAKEEAPGLITKGKRALRKLVLEPEIVDQPLDTRAQAILKELMDLQEKYGFSIEELELLLSYTVKLSRLRITKQYKIILEDFDKIEVKMDKLTKAVFLLYLKHPEGIRYKDLGDYRDKLEDIYTSISGRSDMDAIRKSISDLTDSIMSNSINEKVSKARKAFRDVIDERIARFYYIDGKQGAAKNIVLDRALVIWEQ